MVIVRSPDSIQQVKVDVVNGSCHGRWHFSFGGYHDPDHMRFGDLRVFNDDTLDPGAVWPLHPHREIEVVTYCAEGEFLHEDENGRGDILKEGWVQHTTVGRGMQHSEINNRADAPMRFIQMWITPRERGLDPYWDVKKVEAEDRTDRWLPLVSNEDDGALRIAQDARVLSCRLTEGTSVEHEFVEGRAGYLYVVKGGPIRIGSKDVEEFGAAEVRKPWFEVGGLEEAELLLVETRPFAPAV